MPRPRPPSRLAQIDERISAIVSQLPQLAEAASDTRPDTCEYPDASDMARNFAPVRHYAAQDLKEASRELCKLQYERIDLMRPKVTPSALKVACVDFETYYNKDFGVHTLGIRKYMEHPLFDPYLVAIHGDGIEFTGEPKDFAWEKLDGYQIIAHNASFDEAIFQFWGKPRWCPTWRTQLPWQCTADLSAFLGLGRSLKDAAKHGLGVEVSKTVRKDMMGKRWAELDAGTRASWIAYAGEDARLSYLLWKEYADKWPATERELSMLTRRMGWRGLMLDADLLRENTLILRAHAGELLTRIPFVDENTTPAARKKFDEACVAAGVPPPTTRAQKSEEWEKWLETYGEKVPWAPAVADYQRVNRMLKLYETLDKRKLTNGRFSYGKKYAGAHTLRWSGGDGFNMENLNRDELHGTDIRNVFIAGPGKRLIGSDLSQIEPRVLAWRAGETDFLDLCRKGISPYVAHGLMTGRVEDAGAFEKARKVKGSDDAHAYSGLKAEVLLLGYGGGAETFLRSAKLYGIDTDLLNAKRIVHAFREGRPKVVGLWRELERDWRMAYSCGHNPILLPLPSGRHLRYFNPRITDREAHARTSLDARLPSKIYGGLLTENFVQAAARDVLADMLLRLSRYDWLTPLMTVHDEILFEVDEHRAEEGLTAVKKEMSTPPAWAPDLPVDCDSALIECYTK